jgi:hypothetical protein
MVVSSFPEAWGSKINRRLLLLGLAATFPGVGCMQGQTAPHVDE